MLRKKQDIIEELHRFYKKFDTFHKRENYRQNLQNPTDFRLETLYNGKSEVIL